MDPSRLTVLHATFAKYLSWSQPFLYRLLRDLGRDVRNIVLCKRTANLKRFPTPDVYRIDDRHLSDERVALLAASVVHARWRPDLVHAHFGYSAIRMVPLAYLLQVPLIVTFGGRDVSHDADRPRRAPLYAALLARAVRIVCVSEDLRRRLLDRGVPPERIVVIHRGTDLDRFSFVDRSGRRDGRPLRLLMVGRLVEKKGHRDAFQAVNELTRAGVPVHLTVVGDGSERRSLLDARKRLGLSGEVELAGRTDSSGVVEHYRRADLLLHPSLTASDGDAEGLPNVVVEAAATGLPVVATRHGGIVEVVRHGATGLLVEERDLAGLVGSIRALAEDPERRLAMGRAAAEWARDRFDLAVQVTRHLELYRQVTREHSTGNRQPGPPLDPSYCAALRRALDETEETILGHLRGIAQRRLAHRSRPVFRAPGRWPPEGARRYGLLVPAGVRRGLRSLLGRMSSGQHRVRDRGADDDVLAPAKSFRQAALEFVATGGRLDEVNPSWNVTQLERFLADRR